MSWLPPMTLLFSCLTNNKRSIMRTLADLNGIKKVFFFSFWLEEKNFFLLTVTYKIWGLKKKTVKRTSNNINFSAKLNAPPPQWLWFVKESIFPWLTWKYHLTFFEVKKEVKTSTVKCAGLFLLSFEQLQFSQLSSRHPYHYIQYLLSM